VPIAASSSCAHALTCLLQALGREQTWEALASLLIFPRIALATPARGGKATRSSATQQCRLHCLSSVLDPLEELVTHIKREATAEDPRTRARTRAAAAPEGTDTSPQASDPTAAAVRALLAEGAPGRALQLLTSDGVCDSADPAVLARLRELQPPAGGPKACGPLAQAPPRRHTLVCIRPAPRNGGSGLVVPPGKRGGAIVTAPPAPAELPELSIQRR